ncbi:MAG TPA: hypothetical protein VH677_04850 [Nitrososphaera sp.]
MPDFVIRGRVADGTGRPVADVYIEAVDSDQELFEDSNDDMIAVVKPKSDGTFEIPFDSEPFKDGWAEGHPDLYLAVRNMRGQVVQKTEIRRGVKADDAAALTFDITVDSLEKKVPAPPDPYARNNDRVVAAFSGIGDAIEFRTEDISRNIALFNCSINGWTHYTRQDMWDRIGYDGPQVPRFPWRQDHRHRLWEGGR